MSWWLLFLLGILTGGIAVIVYIVYVFYKEGPWR